jgi:hypothetical protein
MSGLEQRLRARREEVLGALTDEQRAALAENPTAPDIREVLRVIRHVTDGLWDALLEVAREVDSSED